MDVVQFSYYIDILLGYPEIVISQAFFLKFLGINTFQN
jgi:hypothetical protein